MFTDTAAVLVGEKCEQQNVVKQCRFCEGNERSVWRREKKCSTGLRTAGSKECPEKDAEGFALSSVLPLAGWLWGARRGSLAGCHSGPLRHLVLLLPVAVGSRPLHGHRSRHHGGGLPWMLGGRHGTSVPASDGRKRFAPGPYTGHMSREVERERERLMGCRKTAGEQTESLFSSCIHENFDSPFHKNSYGSHRALCRMFLGKEVS